jgi:hypothetical protein
VLDPTCDASLYNIMWRRIHAYAYEEEDTCIRSTTCDASDTTCDASHPLSAPRREHTSKDSRREHVVENIAASPPLLHRLSLDGNLT